MVSPYSLLKQTLIYKDPRPVCLRRTYTVNNIFRKPQYNSRRSDGVECHLNDQGKRDCRSDHRKSQTKLHTRRSFRKPKSGHKITRCVSKRPQASDAEVGKKRNLQSNCRGYSLRSRCEAASKSSCKIRIQPRRSCRK